MMAASLAAACDNPERQRIQQVRSQLVGTWRYEGSHGGEQVQRTLHLGQDGKFTDTVRIQNAGQKPQDPVEYAGEWTYDGIHLKRRYMRENGRQYSGGGLRYSTFPLTSVAPAELVVQDNIANEQRRYVRIA